MLCFLQVNDKINVERFVEYKPRTPEQSRNRFVQLSAEAARLDASMKKVREELVKSYRDPKNKW